MHCPVCRANDTRVIHSRVSPDGMGIRRRRECERCSYRFSTLEEVELMDITVIKNDGSHEAYDREKMVRGLKSALGKRPYTEAGFKALVHKIEREIQKKKKREVTSREVGEAVMRHMQTFDKIGFIRFASVYRAFEDVTSFVSELEKLKKSKGKKRVFVARGKK